VAGSTGRGLEARTQEPADRFVGRVDATIEIHGPEDRLHRVGQDRRLEAAAGCDLPPAQAQQLAEPDRSTHLRQSGRVHQRGAGLGQVAFGPVAETRVEPLRHHEAQDRVAEELQPFVRGRPRVLSAPGAVGEGKLEQRGVAEPVAEPVHEHRGFRRSGPDRQPSFATT
jgi:hypothetical protein